ncbi:hypothetical protein L1K04_09415, partial [Bifidobacterium bifidum]|nr:hypothetical protein [Bifidobacterium bifidum]
AKEVEERPLRGTPLTYHAHHRGSNASIHNWQRTRYEQGFDAAHPDPQGGDEGDAEQKNAKTTRNDPVDYGPRRNTRTASRSLTR